MNHGHTPVLHTEVLSILRPAAGERVLDCTLGLGGHAAAFLDAIGPAGTLYGLDADAGNLESSKKRLGSSAQLHHANFRDALSVVREPVDIVFADLGLSSPHVDDPARGFTFRVTAPLDLRYDRCRGVTAAELLMSSSEQQITEILREFGEIQRSHLLAKELHAHFHSAAKRPGEWTTDDVRACIEKVFTYRAPKVLPQVFQALRIAVNDEIGALQALLEALPPLVRPGGRVGIISYHSLEDRMVKKTFRALTTHEKHPQTGAVSIPAPWDLLTKKPIAPSSAEITQNPRSRSARLRCILRLT